MDYASILAELRQERERIEEAIASLERLARARGPRRGRPPAWLAEIGVKTGQPAGSTKPKSNGRVAKLVGPERIE